MDAAPSAVLAVHTAFRAALPAPPAADAVEVWLGVDPTRPWVPRAVTVAASFDDDLDPVTVARTGSGARPHYIENIDITCSAFVGGTDLATCRAAMGEIVAALDGALRIRANPALAAVVGAARRGFTRWIDWRDEDNGGEGVIVDFIVALSVVS